MNAITKQRQEIQIAIAANNSSSPSGLVWDGDNHSCAYDVLFTVLYKIWSTNVKEDSGKSTSTTSSHYLSVLENI